MNCQKIKKLLNPYIDQILDVESTQQVNEHLKYCPACREEYSKLKQVIFSLNSLSPQPVPENLTENIMAKISQKEFQIQTSWMDLLRGAVGRHNPGFVVDAHLFQSFDRILHHRLIRGASHDNTYQRQDNLLFTLNPAAPGASFLGPNTRSVAI